MSTEESELGGQPAVWSWRSSGWSKNVVVIGSMAGAAMVAGGAVLAATGETGSGAMLAAGLLLAFGGLAILVVLIYWLGREALALRPDGTLEYFKRSRCKRSVALPTHPQVAMARVSVTKRHVDSHGGSNSHTIHYLAVVPIGELDRIKPRRRPPRDLLTLSNYPKDRDDELRVALEQFTKVLTHTVG